MVDQVIKLKRNTTNTNAPGTSDIAVGELAIGAVAGKLYIRKSDDSILEFTDATASSSAADDISTGDAAVTIATTSGNITIDAQANDSDIIFKGTDGGSDTTFLTLDGSAAGAATFNDKIVATELDISGDVDIDGTLEADAVTVNGTALSSVIAGTTVTLASTATALANARTIGGVSFDGSANITPTTFAAATFSGDVNVDSGVLFADVSTNRVGINQTSPDVSLDLGANTDSIHVPVGTTAQRPGSPAAGYFRYNSTSGKFEGYTDSWGSIGGGSGTNMDTNIFTGDGSDTTFTLSTAPDTENNLMVFVDGVFQAQNVYSVSGTTLTFATAPANGRVITVYHSTTTVGGSNNTINTMTGDNSDTTLTLSVAPVHENNVQVYFDGVYQSKSNYAIDGTTLTFSTAPATGVLVEAITNTNTSSTTANQLIDADSDTKIQVEESSDEDIIRFDIAGTEQIVLADGVLRPTTDNDIDLGTSSLEFKDGYFDGTLYADAIDLNGTNLTAFDTDAAQVFNESGADADFRVESNNNADMLFVDGGNDNVLLGTQNQGHIRLNQQLGLAVTGNVYGGISMATHSSSAGGNRSLLDFNRSRNTTIGSHTVVQSGDSLGTIVGRGDDGDEFLDAASIDFEVDGTPGNGDMPGRIVFATTADGASSVTERLRIDSSGNIQIVGGNQMTQGLFFYNGGGGHLLSGIRNKSHSSYNDSGGLEFLTSGTSNAAESVKMSIDTQGNVGIGQSSPDSVLHVKGSSDTVLTMEGGASDANCRINFQNSGGTFRGMLSYDTDDNNLQFNVNDAERMRITSAGVLSIGDASPESGDASAPTSLYLQGGEANMIIKNTDATSSSQRQGIAFLNSGGTRVGTITITTSTTGFTHNSDYRLKENIDYTWDATTRLKELKPVRFNWIVDDTNTLVDGFLAHEVSSVVPEAVTGEKDGDEMQGIDQSKLIPLLVKTIQELEARIATLEG